MDKTNAPASLHTVNSMCSINYTLPVFLSYQHVLRDPLKMNGLGNTVYAKNMHRFNKGIKKEKHYHTKFICTILT